MKLFPIAASIAGVALVGLGTLTAITNPGPAAFEDFAIAQLREEACKQAPLGLDKQCPTFVNDNQAELKRLITQNTERQNFIFFSIYQTDLSLRAIAPGFPFLPNLPSYHFQTVGALGRFYIREAKKRQESWRSSAADEFRPFSASQ